MNYKNRILSMLLSCSVLLAPVSMTAAAADAEEAEWYDSEEYIAESIEEYAEPEVFSEEMLPDTYDYLPEDYLLEDDGILSSEMMAASTTVLQNSSGYRVQFQNAAAYAKVPYGSWGGTVYSSACGPAAACNALYEAGLADVDLLTMCKLAESCGARVDGGTIEAKLLQAAGQKYNFTYTTTSDPEVLRAHLAAGKTAICHAGNSYPLFTTNGHFIAAVKINGNTVTVLDSYWDKNKFTKTAIRRENVKVLSEGVVHVSLSQLNKACSDRSPRYYLLDKVKPAIPFTDVASDIWYFENVKYVYQNGLMNGQSSTSFEPNGKLTRAEIVQILYNYEKKKFGTPSTSGAKSFSDVPSGQWYTTAVNWASANNIVSGTGGGKFSPSALVTREQFMQILCNYIKKRASSKYIAGSSSQLSSFADRGSVSSWAQEGMAWAIKSKIIYGAPDGGKNYLLPKSSAKRCEAAALIQRFAMLIG